MATLSCKIDTAHRDVIHDAQLNFYGNRLATCSSDRLIKVFEVKANGQTFPLAELSGHTGPVWQLSWAHPKFGGVLASAGYDKRVIVWTETSGRFQKMHEWSGHETSVNGLSFSPYKLGLILATASSDSSIGILSFHQASSQWNDYRILKAHEQGVNAVSWAPALHSSPDSSADQPLPKRFVSCGNDKLIKIWKEEDGEWKCEKTLAAHSDFVKDVAWCPVANNTTHTIVSCGQDRNLYLWRCNDIAQGEWIPKLIEKADGALWHISWSLCGTMLSVSGEDNKVILWKENLQGQWMKIEEDQEKRNRN
ncbi:unnamed protein product [Auanema sp. JU1783]|nr:unnamed protein product [Auanema sp. JU1783]